MNFNYLIKMREFSVDFSLKYYSKKIDFTGTDIQGFKEKWRCALKSLEDLGRIWAFSTFRKDLGLRLSNTLSHFQGRISPFYNPRTDLGARESPEIDVVGRRVILDGSCSLRVTDGH
jgi:hypothetical protein